MSIGVTNTGAILLRSSASPVSHDHRGVTLIELLVVLAVLAVLLGIGVPSYRSFIEHSRTDAQSSELLTALQLARSEAIKRNTRVTVCKSADGAACTSAGDWAAGWVVFPDPGNPGVVDPGETVLLAHSELSGSRVAAAPALADSVSYLSSGRARSGANAMQSGALTICPSSGSPDGRVVSVQPGTGLPSVDSTTSCS